MRLLDRFNQNCDLFQKFKALQCWITHAIGLDCYRLSHCARDADADHRTEDVHQNAVPPSNAARPENTVLADPERCIERLPPRWLAGMEFVFTFGCSIQPTGSAKFRRVRDIKVKLEDGRIWAMARMRRRSRY